VTEAWRKKRYYEPRITVPVDILTETELPDTLVCLSGTQLALVRSLLAYATRRITWVSEYHDDYYLSPTTAEWDDIQAMTADLEGRLMTDCVTPLVEALDRIDATIAAQAANLTAIEGELAAVASNVGDLLAPLQCICSKDPNINITNVVSPDWPSYPDADKSFGWGKTLPVATVPALVDQEACNLAQCWYQAGFELVTEVFLPIFGAGYGDLLPAAAAALAVFTGGTTLPIVIGVYALTDLLQELGEIAWEAAEANLINWMFTHKEDIVCLLYTGIKDGGTGTSLWQPVATELVEPSADLSAGDKVLVNFFFGIIGGYAARIAQTANSAWYQSVPEAGFCDDCEDPPIVGDDWVAIPWPGPGGDFTMDHTPGSYWLSGCWDYDIPDGFTMVGCFFEVSEYSGNCQLKRMDGPGSGCGQSASFSPNTSDNLVNNWYYQRDEWNHDHDQAVAQVHPGSVQITAWNTHTSLHASQAFQSGWNCTGYARITIKYLVFAGTTPP
jgi:hypothetical protein